MSFTFGKNFIITLFGESHAPMIGAIIQGLPAGFKPDLALIQQQLQRRRGGETGTTARIEADQPQWVSGLFEGFTTLAPLSVIFTNNNIISADYSELRYLMRPGHADYPAYIKSRGYYDYRGGGSFSARLTAPLVVAGTLARQYLQTKQIVIGSHITAIGSTTTTRWQYPEPSIEQLKTLATDPFPVIDNAIKQEMEQAITKAVQEHDSLGGMVELAVVGLPAGVGQPFFDSLESVISHLLFAVPSVKAVEFGDGIALASLKGSQANDGLSYDNSSPSPLTSSVIFSSNHQGGINGGLSNGNPLIVRVTLRAASSIALSQETINVKTGQNQILTLQGRHDTCPCKRAAVVLESALAVAITELLMAEQQ